jgi:hypothetical protein
VDGGGGAILLHVPVTERQSLYISHEENEKSTYTISQQQGL